MTTEHGILDGTSINQCETSQGPLWACSESTQISGNTSLYNNGEKAGSDALSGRTGQVQAALLKLPLELRQYMYNYIFHSPGCTKSGSCHCGDSLSITNRQLYQEIRPLVYKHSKPRFSDERRCIQFLRDIKGNVAHIRSLSMIAKELSSHSYRLADVFRFPGVENLQEFNLTVEPWQTGMDLVSPAGRATSRTPPVYSLFEERRSPATVYDMSLRVSRHPLAAMKHLRKLTVEGHPQSDIEEAIFKASRNIEELGRREGREIKRWEREIAHAGPYAAGNWLYGIEIAD